jgi:rhomboid protease GluP
VSIHFPPHPDDPVVVLRSRSHARASDGALVLEAMGIEYVIDHELGHWCLRVAPEDAQHARRELSAARRENHGAGARAVAPAPARVDSGVPGVAAYLLVLWSLPALQSWSGAGAAWTEAGLMQAGVVRAGAWWRAVTALTLHADLAHLVANSFFGAVFGLFAGRHLGSGFAWLLILLAGAGGNVLNAWLRDEAFRSLGASTATFAAVALVGAVVWRRGHFRGASWRRRTGPVFAALALLAYTGMGDGEGGTDVLAHVTGFACGFLTGWVVAPLDARRLGRSGQGIAGALALGLVVAAWAVALRVPV